MDINNFNELSRLIKLKIETESKEMATRSSGSPIHARMGFAMTVRHLSDGVEGEQFWCFDQRIL